MTGPKRFDQIEQIDVQPGIVIFRGIFGDARIGPDIFFDHPLLLQHLGGVLIPLMLQQAIDELRRADLPLPGRARSVPGR